LSFDEWLMKTCTGTLLFAATAETRGGKRREINQSR